MPNRVEKPTSVSGPPPADQGGVYAWLSPQFRASSAVPFGGLHHLASLRQPTDELFEDQSLMQEHLIADSIEATKYKNLHETTTQNIDQHLSRDQDPELGRIKLWALWRSSQEVLAANVALDVGSFGLMSRLIVNLPWFQKALYERKLLDARPAVSQLRLVHASWYEEACQDLAEISLEASELGLEAPLSTTEEIARNMLNSLSKNYDQLPDVQPMRDGSIGIKFENRDQRSSVLFVIESKGSAVMFVRINGVPYRIRTSDASKILPGGFHAMDEAGIRRI